MRFDELFLHEQRVRRTSFVVKILVLALTCLCMVSFSLSGASEDHGPRLALAWITFGSQIVMSSFFFIGTVIGETTPKLTLVQSAVGGALFFSSSVCSLVSYFDRYEPIPSWDVAGLSALLAAALLSLLTAALLALDVFFAITLRRLSPARAPFWSMG